MTGKAQLIPSRMSPESSFCKYLKVQWIFVLSLLIYISCEKGNPLDNRDFPLTPKEDTLKDYSPIICFDATAHMLEGKGIRCIEPNYNGNTWIASGTELYYYKNDSLENTYTLDFEIFDISIAGDETLWISTRDVGLGHLTENGITWYTVANCGLPRDYIRNVEVGLDGHVIFDIGIDHDGSIYVVTNRYVYRIYDDLRECLDSNKTSFYWTGKFTAGPAGTLYLLEDFSASSSWADTTTLWEYQNNSWNKLKPDFMTERIALFTAMKADRRDYCWVASIDGNSYVLHVYNGTSWGKPPEGLFLGDMITTIETDMDNNVWVDTAHNVIFILKQ